MFAQRYRDVVDSIGGKTTADVDQRPTLLSHTKLYGSGYDVDGTSQDSLGQYSGRVTTSFKHGVPRFFCNEHGAIWTVALIRFQPILNCENNFLDCKRGVTYEELACDPVLLANTPRVEHNIEDYLTGHYAPAGFNSFPYTNGNWYREHPSFVNSRFTDLQGFPFLSYNNLERIRPWQIRPSVYDDIFQTDQLKHWQIYGKSNAMVLRAIPSSRETLLADSSNH